MGDGRRERGERKRENGGSSRGCHSERSEESRCLRVREKARHRDSSLAALARNDNSPFTVHCSPFTKKPAIPKRLAHDYHAKDAVGAVVFEGMGCRNAFGRRSRRY